MSRLLAANDQRTRHQLETGSCEAPAIRVDVDRGQIEQALLNILKNAIEAIDGTGTITIRLSSAAGRSTLAIEDTGPGIAAEAQSNLFTPFFSTKPHGQGIGLTLVQEILSAHGFDYGIERTAHGTTRFSIVMDSSRPGRAQDDVAVLPTRQAAQ